jgi:cell division protein FtsB
MADYQVSQRKHKWFYSPIVLLVMIGVCIFFTTNVVTLVRKNKDTRLLRDQASRELTELENRRQKLETDIASLKSERGQEEVIRENFQVTKDGEGVVVIVDEEEKPVETEKKETFFEKIMPNRQEMEF